MNTHFCFSELLILREKKIRGFSYGPLEYQKNYKFSKNIEKTPYRRVAQKRHNFAPGTANHTFFDSPCMSQMITKFVFFITTFSV